VKGNKMKKYLILISLFSSSVFAAQPLLLAEPGAPENVQIEYPTPDQARISWADTTSNEDGFELNSNGQTLVSVGANVTSIIVPVYPGNTWEWKICARFGENKACAFPDMSMPTVTPRATGQVYGRVVDANFQPIINKTFQFVGTKLFTRSQEIYFTPDEDYYFWYAQGQIDVPDHISVIDKNAVSYAEISASSDCRLDSSTYLHHMGASAGVLENLADSKGAWTYYISTRRECYRATIQFRIEGQDVVRPVTTDCNGNFSADNLPLAGTYTFEADGFNCLFIASGGNKISLTKSQASNIVCRPTEPPNR